MPKIEAKVIQKELESGKVRPLYWIFGPERMKARELMKRILRTVLQDAQPNDFNCERLDGSEISIETIIDSAQSFSLMGGTKLILVRNADEIKNLDPVVDFLKSLENTSPAAPDTFNSICVFVAKSFDGRKKASKVIQDLGAAIPCEEVDEQDREPWVDFLAKRRGLTLKPDERLLLRALDPWSLEIVDQELGKVELVKDEEALRAQVILTGVDAHARDEFIDAIFSRNKARAMKHVHLFSEEMEVQLPVLGLISWNLRHLKLYLIEQATRSRSAERRNPYLLKNLDRWKPKWTVSQIQDLEHDLFEIDFSLKNTRLTGRGLWNTLLMENCS